MSSSEANRKQVPIRASDAGTAWAAVEAARANLQAAELQLSYTTITASIDGIVTEKASRSGRSSRPARD